MVCHWAVQRETRTKHRVPPSTEHVKKKKRCHWRHDPRTTISQKPGRAGGGGVANEDQAPPPWVSITDAAASWVGKYCTCCSGQVGATPCVCKSVEWQLGAHGKVAVAVTLTPNEIPPHFQAQACTSPCNLLIHLDQLPVPLERRRCSEVKAENGRHQEVSQQLMTSLRLAGSSFTRIDIAPPNATWLVTAPHCPNTFDAFCRENLVQTHHRNPLQYCTRIWAPVELSDAEALGQQPLGNVKHNAVPCVPNT